MATAKSVISAVVAASITAVRLASERNSMGSKRSHEEMKDLEGECQKLIARIKDGDLFAFQHASEELRNNRKVCMAAMRGEFGSYYFRYLSKELRGDFEIALIAVEGWCWSLQYVSQELKGNKAIVTAAVKQHGMVLQFALPNLQDDDDIVLDAVHTQGQAIEYASPRLRATYDFVGQVISVANDFSPSLLYYASQGIQDDLKATAAIFHRAPQALNFLRKSLQSHAAFVAFLLCVKSKEAAKAGIPVTMLHVGQETFEKLHRHIAEYAGVPAGQELEPVRLVKRVKPILESLLDKDADAQHKFWTSITWQI